MNARAGSAVLDAVNVTASGDISVSTVANTAVFRASGNVSAAKINVSAGGALASMDALNIVTTDDVTIMSTGTNSATLSTTGTAGDSIGGNFNLTGNAAGGGATFTAGGDVQFAAGKNITMTTNGAGGVGFNAADVTGVNDIALNASDGTANFNATGDVTATGKIDILSTGTGGSALFSVANMALSGGDITIDASGGTGGTTFNATGTVTDAGSINIKDNGTMAAGFSAGGEVSLTNGNNITLDSTGGIGASFAAGSLYAKGNTTVDLSSGTATTFVAGTALKVGDGNQDATFTFINNGTPVTWGTGFTSLELNRATLDLTDASNSGTYGARYTFDNSDIKLTGGNNIKTNAETVTVGAGKTVDFNLTGLKNGEAVLTVDNTTIDFTNVGPVTITSTGQTGIIGAVQEEIKMVDVANGGAIIDETALGTAYTGADSMLVQYGVGTFYGYDVDTSSGLVLRSNGTGADTFDLYSDAGAAQILTLTQSGQLVVDSIGRVAHRNGEGVKMDLNMVGFSYDNSVGSKVEVDGFGAVLSLGYTAEGAASKFTFGGFVEAGNGSYDAYNTLSIYGDTEGDGETKYFGGGLFLHNIWENGFYVEASGRIGSADHDFKYKGQAFQKYDGKSSTYYGAHAGLGYKFAPGWERGEFDIYGKFAWTRMEGYDFRLSAIEKLKMDDVDSYRTRLGTRYTHSYDNGTELYVGAAWDHEFDGESKGRIVGGHKIKGTAKTEGSSAFFETGLRINPADTPVSIDVGLFGSAGQNQGIGGTVGLKWEF